MNEITKLQEIALMMRKLDISELKCLAELADVLRWKLESINKTRITEFLDKNCEV